MVRYVIEDLRYPCAKSKEDNERKDSKRRFTWLEAMYDGGLIAVRDENRQKRRSGDPALPPRARKRSK